LVIDKILPNPNKRTLPSSPERNTKGKPSCRSGIVGPLFGINFMQCGTKQTTVERVIKPRCAKSYWLCRPKALAAVRTRKQGLKCRGAVGGWIDHVLVLF
jgi:hypothetical protein